MGGIVLLVSQVLHLCKRLCGPLQDLGETHFKLRQKHQTGVNNANRMVWKVYRGRVRLGSQMKTRTLPWLPQWTLLREEEHRDLVAPRRTLQSEGRFKYHHYRTTPSTFPCDGMDVGGPVKEQYALVLETFCHADLH
eukprot:4378988-Amphidinium_carterae.1